MSHNGTVVGTPTFAAAKFSNGLTAVSDANYITLPTGTSPAGLGPGLVWEAWLNPGAVSAIGVALCLSSNATWCGVLANGHFGYSYNSGSTIDSGISISNGSYHHCALVFTSTAITPYVDGVAGTGTAISFTALATGMFVGRFQSTGFRWPGGIDEVAIWVYQKYTGNFTPPSAAYTGSETGLLALYHLQSDGTDSAVQPLPLVITQAPVTNANQGAKHQLLKAPTDTAHVPSFVTPVPVASVLQNGTTGAAYSETITTQGGTAAYTYAVTSGSLPTGLTLTGSTGVIAGTPTVAGSSTFTITVTDANGYTGSQSFSITVAAPAASNYGFVA